MQYTFSKIPIQNTGYFSALVVDYLVGKTALLPFYAYPPSLAGVEEAIAGKHFSVGARQALVQALQQQYAAIATTDAVQTNIKCLGLENTFTITTAHQCNLFTGPLYFVYKILHVIKLATSLQEAYPQYNFVPLFYMGSEDADFEELNHVFIQGKKIAWQTNQTGAVGRMLVDTQLLRLIEEIEGQIGGLPHGHDICNMLRQCYQQGSTIQQATFMLVDALFQQYGVVVLIPDNPQLKYRAVDIFKDELFNASASPLVERTNSLLAQQGYKSQASPREINLFYLHNNIRQRIVRNGDNFSVLNTGIVFTPRQMEEQLNVHPERFSPNVILRGLFQEVILPNIVFVGGGGELAYWLQLKRVLEHHKQAFPVLVLRNSFLFINKNFSATLEKLSIPLPRLFDSEHGLIADILKQSSPNKLDLSQERQAIVALYKGIQDSAVKTSVTLEKHVAALQHRAIEAIQELEKKMLRAEKRKFTDTTSQIIQLKAALFPSDGLQERKENILWYYALHGKGFIHTLLAASGAFEQEFAIVQEC